MIPVRHQNQNKSKAINIQFAINLAFFFSASLYFGSFF